MKTLTICLFLLSFPVRAQQPQQADQTILGYTQDIKIDGKVYERYQTTKGDNVLISKEAAHKRGVRLFTYARQVLAREGLVQVGLFGFANTSFNQSHVIAKRSEVAAQSGRTLTAVDTFDTSAMEWPGQVTGRLPFYRHVRGIVSVGFQESPDTELGTRPAGPTYQVAFDHDLIVIPVPRSFIAFSMGYFRSSHGMDFGFREADGTSTKIRSRLVEQGPSFTMRYSFGDFDEGQSGKSSSISLEVTYQKSKSGNSRTLTGITWGFGGSHGPLSEK